MRVCRLEWLRPEVPALVAKGSGGRCKHKRSERRGATEVRQAGGIAVSMNVMDGVWEA